MPKPTNFAQVSSVNFYMEETNQSTAVGTLMFDQIGRGYRYTLAGGSALVKGNLIQAAAEDTQFNEMAVPAAVAANATVIGVTLGSTATTADLFKDGVLCISVTPGIGQVYRILSHDVASGGATCNFTVEDPLDTALTTSSKVTVRQNPYRSTIQQPTTHTGAAVGGAIHAITASKYGWLQTVGVGAALTDATVVAATTMGLSPSVTTAGTVTKHVNQDQYVGRSLVAVNVSAKVYPVFWQLM